MLFHSDLAQVMDINGNDGPIEIRFGLSIYIEMMLSDKKSNVNVAV